jgi:hypothetical protein
MNAHGIRISGKTQSSRAASCRFKRYHHVYAMKVTIRPPFVTSGNRSTIHAQHVFSDSMYVLLLFAIEMAVAACRACQLPLARKMQLFVCVFGGVPSSSRLPLIRALFVHMCCRSGVFISSLSSLPQRYRLLRRPEPPHPLSVYPVFQYQPSIPHPQILQLL